MDAHGQSVLVVDDEASFVDALTIGLQREGYRVHSTGTGNEALRLFEEIKPDFVLLDVMLPGLSGIDVCRRIRANSQTPIIMMSARNSEIDAVVGLEVGADDYVTKPYRLRELLARMAAVMRRAAREVHDEPDVSAYELAGVRLDAGSHEVRVEGAVVAMPLKEFDILRLPMESAGRVVTREQLIDAVWGHDYRGDSKTLDVHIKRLRGRIERDRATPQRITTIRGLGYRFERRP